MKYIQLVFSPTGGTKKIADVVINNLAPSWDFIDLSNASFDFQKVQIQSDDVVVIAMPSFAGRVPAIAVERLGKIKGNFAKCILVCVYGNRAYEDTLVEMQDEAQKSVFNIIAAISAVAEHSIMHQYATGRPDEKDCSLLKEYTEKIKNKLNENLDTEIVLPGNRPYKKIGGAGLVPKATKDCISCGNCAKKCPTQAINLSNLKTADSKKCIACMRCVAECPYNARKVNDVMVSIASLAIKKACSVRKECELFI